MFDYTSQITYQVGDLFVFLIIIIKKECINYHTHALFKQKKKRDLRSQSIDATRDTRLNRRIIRIQLIISKHPSNTTQNIIKYFFLILFSVNNFILCVYTYYNIVLMYISCMFIWNSVHLYSNFIWKCGVVVYWIMLQSRWILKYVFYTCMLCMFKNSVFSIQFTFIHVFSAILLCKCVLDSYL